MRELQNVIEVIRQNNALWKEHNFEERLDALDFLEFYLINRIEEIPSLNAELVALKQEAEHLKYQLEAIDTAIFQRLRTEMQTGRCRGKALLERIKAYVRYDPLNPSAGYDALDAFTNGLFSSELLPWETQDREPEMVFYQKTPARIIFELVEKARFTAQDVFYDVGSGLGHVPIWANLLGGTAAKGIEIEPAYCTYATRCAVDLAVSTVEFIQADARTADYSDGTVFFLYTPFEGKMLREVLERLQGESQHRRIRLFTYGPCTVTVARQDWLKRINPEAIHPDKLNEFESR